MTEPAPEQPAEQAVEPAEGSYSIAAEYGSLIPPPAFSGPPPAPREDPALVAALAAAEVHTAQLDDVRSDPDLTDLERAERVAALHNEQVARIQALAENYYARRRARLAALEAEIPIGPGVTPDMSPADKAVVNSAFMAALQRARSADSEQRRAMVVDAITYGDDSLLRAALSAAREVGDAATLDEWARRAGKAAVLAEIRDLSAALARPGIWETKAFRRPIEPPELRRLAELRKAEAEREREREAAREEREARRMGFRSAVSRRIAQKHRSA
ncbi:MAG TPA: hypothetical protein VIK91_01605 [Nannocystis sp.]